MNAEDIKMDQGLIKSSHNNWPFLLMAEDNKEKNDRIRSIMMIAPLTG
jgi:hypothetical protein